MKYLVTGGAGFIGSHLVDALCAGGHEVVVLDDFSTGSEANLPSGVRLVRGDAGDAALLVDLLPGCAAVFHLAAVSSVQASMDRPLGVHHANLTSTLALLDAARHHGVKRFVFSSSAAVYGDTKGEPARESMTPAPLSHYGVQKLASEHYCAVYAKNHGLETVCLRYFNIFGPRQRSDSPYSGVIARFIEAARSGRAATIYGDGSQTRDFCSVANVVQANIAAAKALPECVAGEIFNIGTGQFVSILDVHRAIAAIFPGAPPDPIKSAARPGEVAHSRANIDAARSILHFEPSTNFFAALREVAESP